MVTSSTNLDGLFLQHAHAWCRLTGVQDACLSTLQMLNILIGHGSDTTHALHDVQHQTFSLKQRTHLARDYHGNIALLHTRSILHQDLDLHVRVETTEHLFGNLDTS